MKRYLYLKIIDDTPVEIKHFTDRSAGLKQIAEELGTGVLPEAYWSDELKRAHVITGDYGFSYWLYEVEIY